MVTISAALYHYMIIALIILGGWYIYTVILFQKAKWDKTQLKKFKKICKWEFRDETRMVHLVIKEFIDKYTQEHKINWDEYI